ncbi:hypothetical protein O7627_19090 [Solwaraspora sp. WMMD1047]|uniref:hypothetical protein n=1 Tax=Solwaraspora sp. WMMD1047 TaxID=3016102 RepID=UPI002417BEF6|nr:hypothetical protein [Solwaraspora sp. WMMD1047]MDG4831406.1 hypothetical protein [Solwaraspora sp. WMMD1047]
MPDDDHLQKQDQAADQAGRPDAADPAARTARGRLARPLTTLRRRVDRAPVRTRVTAGALCCLGVLAFAGAQARETGGGRDTGTHPTVDTATAATAAPSTAGLPAGAAGGQGGGAPTAAPPEAAAGPVPVEAAPAEPPAIVNPGPVAGLSQVQVDNAQAIVRTGHDLGLPRRALVIAVATAMQESTLLNRASEVLPESKNYPHQGTGWDHDSVGLFQQRTSSGWGPVAKLMDPAYASQRFFEALLRVPGWQYLRLTEAAQAVQVSAYPEHYARHEAQAEQVVAAIKPTDR